MIDIECRLCGESVKTRDVSKAVVFDREHSQTCTPNKPSEETA